MNTRSRYETKEDRQNEDNICSYIQKCIGDGAKVSPNLGDSYIVDRVLLKNETIISFIEIKRTKYNLSLTTLEWYFISLRKMKDAVMWSRMLKAPFFLVAKFNEGLYYTEITLNSLQEYPIEWGGRTYNIRDSGDNELMLNIPTDQFYNMNTLKDRLEL